MTNYLWYILEANLLMILLFAVFKLSQRFLSFGWQRFSLLSIPLLSIVAVWLKHGMVSSSNWSYQIPVFELEPVEISANSAAVPPVSSAFDVWILLDVAYWLGATLLFAWTLFNIFRMLRDFLKTERRKVDEFTLIEQENVEASSFFRFIQLPAGLSEEDHEIIFQHEKIHALKYHSADRLYMEVVHCLSWFNPLCFLLKKELIYIHEYEVDQIMYNKYRAGYMEFLLAYSLGTSSSIYLFTNQFTPRLTLIKRIKIMKNKSKKVMLVALALPIIAGALTLISFTSKSAALPQSSKKTEPVSMMKDRELIQEEEVTSEAPKMESEANEKEIKALPKEELLTTKQLEFYPTTEELQEDQPAQYVGGMDAMTKYMTTNIHYPDEAVKSKTSGRVYVKFTITETGKVTNVAVRRGVSPELDAEAVRVVAAMPNWIPAEKGGKKIESEMALPVSFSL